MKVIFFAQSRESAGCEEHHLEIEKPVTEPEFWAMLVKIFPGLDVWRKTARLARNQTYLQEGDLIQPVDEIAVIPPVSGG